MRKIAKNLYHWRREVLSRDSHTCKWCGSIAFPQAHHIYPKQIFKAISLHIDNGITLCEECHLKIKGRELDEVDEYLELLQLEYGIAPISVQLPTFKRGSIGRSFAVEPKYVNVEEPEYLKYEYEKPNFKKEKPIGFFSQDEVALLNDGKYIIVQQMLRDRGYTMADAQKAVANWVIKYRPPNRPRPQPTPDYGTPPEPFKTYADDEPTLFGKNAAPLWHRPEDWILVMIFAVIGVTALLGVL